MNNKRNNPALIYKQQSLFMLMVLQLIQNFRGGIVSPILSLFVRSKGLSIAEIGLLGTASMLGWFIWEPLMGLVTDRWNKRWMIIGALSLTTILYGLYPMAHGLWFFVALEFLKTSFMSLYSIPVKALIAELLPSEYKGRVYGRFSTVVSLGGMISPFIGGSISEVYGYDLLFYIAAAIGIIGILAVFSIQYEEHEYSNEIRIKDLRNVLNKSIFRIFCVRSLFFFNVVFIHNFLPIYLNESPVYSASESQIGTFFTLFRFAGAAGRSVQGSLCDRFGSKKLIIISLIGWAVSYLVLKYTGGIYLMYLVGIIQGLSQAGADTSMTLYLISVTNNERLGLIMGLYSEAENIGGLISVPTSGYIYQNMGASMSIWFIFISLIMNAIYTTFMIKDEDSSQNSHCDNDLDVMRV